MSNFLLRASNKAYNAVDNDFEILLKADSIISEISDAPVDALPPNYTNFTKFCDLDEVPLNQAISKTLYI